MPNRPGFKLTTPIIALGLAFLMFVIGAVVFLVHTGKDTQGVMTLLATLIFPTIIGLIQLQSAQNTEARVEQTQQKVESVHQQTNGALSALHQTVARQSDQLAHSIPIDELPVAEVVDLDDDAPGRHST